MAKEYGTGRVEDRISAQPARPVTVSEVIAYNTHQLPNWLIEVINSLIIKNYKAEEGRSILTRGEIKTVMRQQTPDFKEADKRAALIDGFCNVGSNAFACLRRFYSQEWEVGAFYGSGKSGICFSH